MKGRGTRAGAARLDQGDRNGECSRSWARKIENGWAIENAEVGRERGHRLSEGKGQRLGKGQRKGLGKRLRKD